MRKRHDLSITDVADILTSSTDFAHTLVEARKHEIEDEKQGRGLNIPWPLLLAGGAAIAGLFTFMQETEAEIVPEDSSAEPAEEMQGDDDDGESLLSKVAGWLQSIPELVTGTTKPTPPAVSSTQMGQTFVGPPAPETGAVTMQYLNVAASSAGVDPSLVYSVAQIESSLDVNAKNKLTNATGLFQFLPSTWSYLIRKYPKLKFTMQDVNDPQKNAIMGAIYLKQISNTLESALSRKPAPAEIYLGHFLGPDGAIRFLTLLKNDPSATAATHFHAASTTNPKVFYNNGQARTIAEVWSLINGKVMTARVDYKRMSTETAPQIETTQAMNAVPATPTTLGQAPVDVSVLNTKIRMRQSLSMTEIPMQAPKLESEPVITSSTQIQPKKTYARSRNGLLVAIPLD